MNKIVGFDTVLHNFVMLELEARNLFKHKIQGFLNDEYHSRMMRSAKAWCADLRVKEILRDLSLAANHINNNFLAYRLEDVLRLWYFIIGFHESIMWRHDRSHALKDLIAKQQGYSFKTTMAYCCNRFEELISGKDVYSNNERLEMTLAYLCIFLSRLFFSENFPNKDISQYKHSLDLTIGSLIKHKISLTEISHEKDLFLRELEGCMGEINDNNLSLDKWTSLVKLGITNLSNLLSIGSILKDELNDGEWRMLRASLFQRCESQWSTSCFGCRYWEGPAINDESFPFQSIKPSHFEMYGI